MYENILRLFKEKEVLTEPGLTPEEVELIEKLYDISFPQSLKDFLMQVLPVSEGFYNWRNVNDENIARIKSAISRPKEWVYESFIELYGGDNGGKQEEENEKIIREFREELDQAPKLIPIYGHRYMPVVGDNPPVLSVHGVDIIYYGKDLCDYFEVEFGSKKQREIEFSDIAQIEFWSDMI